MIKILKKIILNDKNKCVYSFVLFIQIMLVKVVFAATVIEILLFEGSPVLSPTQRGTGSERVNKLDKHNLQIHLTYINLFQTNPPFSTF